MDIRFSKMHGIGNDYIYINCFTQDIPNPNELAIGLSDRHFGIGGDGIILICPSEIADCKMRMFNADGSEGKMCGNGIRCVGKFTYDKGLVKKNPLTVETLSGIKTLTFTLDEKDEVSLICVDMGAPILKPSEIPLLSEKEIFVDEPVDIHGTTCSLTGISMGNPHAVLFTTGIDALDLEKVGPPFERHPLFPEQVNTEFVEVISKNHFKMRVWERGSGETLACGTGACAVAVAAILNGYAHKDEEIRISLLGGDLLITWDNKCNTVFMRGSATFVFDGIITI